MVAQLGPFLEATGFKPERIRWVHFRVCVYTSYLLYPSIWVHA